MQVCWIEIKYWTTIIVIVTFTTIAVHNSRIILVGVRSAIANWNVGKYSFQIGALT